jgi:tetratricopeptide (TPR) repeat protein
MILVSLLSNKISNPLFDFEGRGSINHDTALAFTYSDPFRNNTDIQSRTSPIYQTNNSSYDVSALVNKGDAFYNQGNYTQAIQYYDKALAIDPHYMDAIYDKDTALNRTASASAFVDRANAFYALGNYTEAIPYFDLALGIDPNNKDALNGKGAALNGLGNYTQAIQYYDMTLAIDPNNKFAFDGKGNALYGLGNDTQAIQYLDKALAIDPNFKQALYHKGFILYGIDNYTQAIQYYNRALSIDPNYTDALNGRQDAISQKVASAPISGFSRGCSDSQIYDPADRYINQDGMGPSFHSKQFMQAYNEGYRACSSSLNSQSKGSSDSGDIFAVQKPYWISHDIYRPNFTNIAVFVDRVDISHNVTYAEICVPTVNPAKPDCHIEKDKPHSDILMVCLNSNVAKITHRVCHIIDTAKELQKSGQEYTGTVNVGFFVFPVAMIPDYKKIEGCIYVSDVSSCESNVYDTGHGLVMHLDTHTAYNNYYDYYSDY